MVEYCNTVDKNGRTIYWRVMEDGRRKRVSKAVAEKGDPKSCAPKAVKKAAPKKASKSKAVKKVAKSLSNYYVVYDDKYGPSKEMKILAIVKGEAKAEKEAKQRGGVVHIKKLDDFDTISFNNWSGESAIEAKKAFELVKKGKEYSYKPVKATVADLLEGAIGGIENLPANTHYIKVATSKGNYDVVTMNYEDLGSLRWYDKIIDLARGYIEYLAKVSPGNLTSLIIDNCKYKGEDFICLYRSKTLYPSTDLLKGKKPQKESKILRIGKGMTSDGLINAGIIYTPSGHTETGDVMGHMYEYSVHGLRVRRRENQKFELTHKDLSIPFIRERARFVGIERLDGYVYKAVRKSVTRYLNEKPNLKLEHCEKREEWKDMSKTLKDNYDAISDYMCHLLKTAHLIAKKNRRKTVRGDDINTADVSIF